jgi:hypothetical protein
MQIKRDFAGSTDMWPTSAGGQLIEVANLTGFTVLYMVPFRLSIFNPNILASGAVFVICPACAVLYAYAAQILYIFM